GFERRTDFDYGPNGWVSALEFDPFNNVMIAAGDFTSRPAVRQLPPSQFVPYDLPARNITAYSTTQGVPGSALTTLGNHVEHFRAAANFTIRRVAVTGNNEMAFT